MKLQSGEGLRRGPVGAGGAQASLGMCARQSFTPRSPLRATWEHLNPEVHLRRFDRPPDRGIHNPSRGLYVDCMVHIIKFEAGTQSIRAHSGVVNAYVQTVVAKDGQRRVHISTFGSAARLSAPKSSQSIQLDRSSAAELVRYFDATFGPGWQDRSTEDQ